MRLHELYEKSDRLKTRLNVYQVDEPQDKKPQWNLLEFLACEEEIDKTLRPKAVKTTQ